MRKFIDEPLYLCDGLACEGGCRNPECSHTRDVTHAKNFEPSEYGMFFVEKAEAVEDKNIEHVEGVWIIKDGDDYIPCSSLFNARHKIKSPSLIIKYSKKQLKHAYKTGYFYKRVYSSCFDCIHRYYDDFPHELKERFKPGRLCTYYEKEK